MWHSQINRNNSSTNIWLILTQPRQRSGRGIARKPQGKWHMKTLPNLIFRWKSKNVKRKSLKKTNSSAKTSSSILKGSLIPISAKFSTTTERPYLPMNYQTRSPLPYPVSNENNYQTGRFSGNTGFGTKLNPSNSSKKSSGYTTIMMPELTKSETSLVVVL